MKKILSFLLIVAMITVLASCGSSSESSGGAKEPSGAEAAQAEPAPSEAPDAGKDGAAAEPAGTEKEDSKEADAVIAENEFYRLRFKGIEPSEQNLYTVKIGIENTGSVELGSPQGKLVKVNGFWLEQSRVPQGEAIPAGGSAGTEIRLFKSDLEAIGVGSVDDIERIDFNFFAYPKGSKISSMDCSVYPSGLEGSYVQKERAAMPGDVLIGETEHVKLTAYWREGTDFAGSFSDDELRWPVLIIENPSGNDYVYQYENLAINGAAFPTSTYSAMTVKAGGAVVIPFSTGIEYELEDKGIKKAEKVAFDLAVRKAVEPFDYIGVYQCSMDSSDLHN